MAVARPFHGLTSNNGPHGVVVEIHVRLREAAGTVEGSCPFPWIDQVEDFLAEQEAAEVYDDGEEYGQAYVFFIAGAAEADLLTIASRPARPADIPSGVFAMATSDEVEDIGLGRRVELPLGWAIAQPGAGRAPVMPAADSCSSSSSARGARSPWRPGLLRMVTASSVSNPTGQE
ncbi:hypothetical protein AB0I51_37395 [Streptomyces sp. NPDC050549]|uniref:hypothetical protein n=1 Tax=Streptomyces sp. NPDC050549 TaxID=3155406 RepID=UPI003415DAEF